MNQELKQYLRFFTEYKQRDWLEWLATAEFVVNNKVYMATRVSSFIANYGKELKIGEDIRKKEKIESTTEFVEKMKKVHEEARVALKKAQKDMKKQVDRERKKTENWRKEDRVILSTKNFITNKILTGCDT